jgi:hypothetical protein
MSKGSVWVPALGLLLCLGALVRVPSWWRGDYRGGRSLGRQRTYLVQWAAITFLAIGLLIATLLPDGDALTKGEALIGLIPMAIGVLILLLMPLVWFFQAFEFLVAPGLRRGALAGQSDFGPPVGPPAAVREPVAAGPAGVGTLRFERPRGGRRDWFLGYRIEIDGGQAGSLRRGGELTIPATAGSHTVRGAIQFTGSPTINIVVRAGETTTVRIRNGTGDPRGAIAGPDTYLNIEVVDE